MYMYNNVSHCIHKVIDTFSLLHTYMYSSSILKTFVDSQSDIAGWFICCYGELEGEYHTHTDGHRDDQLNDLLSSMTKGSLQ